MRSTIWAWTFWRLALRSPRKGDFQAIRAVSQAIRRPVIASLARARTLDVERAAHSLDLAERPRIHTFLACSDLHLEVKLKMSRAAGARPRHSGGPPGPQLCG